MRSQNTDEFGRPIKYIKKMPAAGMKPYCKAAMHRTSGRDKPEKYNPNKAISSHNGRIKIMRFLERGIKLTQKRFSIKKSAIAIRKAILGVK